MNIGIFTDSYLPEVNGVVTSLNLFIKAFKEKGHNVFIFAPREVFHKNLPQANARFFPSILVWGKQVRLALPIITAHSVAKLNLDVIHVQTPGPLGATGLRLGKKLKIPLVYTYHTRIESYAHYYIRLPNWLEKLAFFVSAKVFYNRHNVVVAPSEGIKLELKKFVTKPIVVIPTGVDVESNHLLVSKNEPGEIIKKFGLPPARYLITTSRLGKEKNVGFILKALVKIKQSCPGVKLLVVGDGPDRDNLEAEAQSLGVKNEVIFTGFMEQADLFSLYKKCALFLFSSLTETQGLVVLEALTMGLPAVTLNAVGIEDLLKDNRGGFMTKDLDDFESTVVRVMNDEGLRLKKSAEAILCVQSFTIDKMADKLLAVYQRLV